jgi:membrane-associated phospholipid phosphatase
MTEFVVSAGRRHLPRGWTDLGRQIVIWFGFLGLYQIARGLADRNPTRAFENGLGVINIEERVGDLFEVTLANLIGGSKFLTWIVSFTYWNSEFTVIGLTLLWVYLRRHDGFSRFRNTILLANLIGLIGFVVMPTAPPWMFPDKGFVDGVNHSSALLQSLGNSYAAMPSLHAADALIVGWFLVVNSRTIWAKALWALWPAWVWFCVIATANHYLLDVLAGIGVAFAALLATAWGPRLFARLRGLGPVIANLL